MVKIIKYISTMVLFFICMNSYAAPHEYKAIYSLTLKGIEFANSEHKIEYNDEHKHWCLNTTSYTVSIFSLKEDYREENSCFNFNDSKYENDKTNSPQKNDYLSTKKYIFKRIKSNRQEKIVSEMKKGVLVSIFNDEHVEYDENSKIDRLVAQMFGYVLKKISVSDKGRQRIYNFENMGETNIKSIFGDTKVIKIKKTILNNKRSTITWYSTERNYLPLMIEQYRLDKLMFKATLIEYKE